MVLGRILVRSGDGLPEAAAVQDRPVYAAEVTFEYFAVFHVNLAIASSPSFGISLHDGVQVEVDAHLSNFSGLRGGSALGGGV